jgi:hypothetical protein
MIVELSNQELKDIYQSLGTDTMNDSEQADLLRKDGKKHLFILADKLEKGCERKTILLAKIFKLIKWEEE